MTTASVVAGSGQTNQVNGDVVNTVSDSDDLFNTEHPQGNGPLDVPAEDAGELADTDNYRGFSERAVIQELEETLAENEGVPEQLENDVKNAMQAMEQISLLQEFQSRIAKRGIGIPDVVSIESHFPGMLLRKAPAIYSYRPSDTNVTYSQEAIGERIQDILKKGKEMLDKLIVWIIDHCKKAKAKFTELRIKSAIDKFNGQRADTTDNLSVPQILQLLGNDTSSYDGNGIVGALTSFANTDIKLELFKQVQTSDPYSWVRQLGDMQIRVPDALLTKKSLSMVNREIWRNLREALMENGNNDTTLSSKLANNPNYQKIKERTSGKWETDGPTLVDMIKRINDGDYLTTLVKSINEIEELTGNFKRRIDKEWRDLDKSGNTELAKAERAAAHDALRTITSVATGLSSGISTGLLVLQWATFSTMYSTKDNIMRIKNTDHEMRD